MPRGVDILTPVLVVLVRTAAAYLLAAGQLTAARHLTGWAVRQAPSSAELWALRGQVLLRTAAVLSPRRPEDVAAALEEAEAAYARALQLRPDWPEVRRQRGLVLLRLAWTLAEGSAGAEAPRTDLLKDSVAEFTRVLQAHPRRADVLHERAMAQATLRIGLSGAEALACLQQALEDLDRSLQLRPHAPETLLHRAEVCSELARLYRRAGRRTLEVVHRRRSLEDGARALRLRPDWEPVLLLRCMDTAALVRLGEDPGRGIDEALGVLSRMLERSPRHAQALLVRADVRVAAACQFAARGDARASLVWRQALTDLEAAMDAVGLRGREDVVAVRAAARAEWAEALQRAGDLDGARDAWQRALDDYDRAVDDDPADAERLAGRARVHAALAELVPRAEEAEAHRRRALEDFAQALALRPGDPVLLAARAEVLCAPGTAAADLRAALEEVEAALAASPEHGPLRAARRRLLLALVGSRAATGPEERAGWVARALADCEWALHEDPGDAGAHYDHARALFCADRPAESYAALEQALRKWPGLRHTARRDPVWSPVAEAEGFRRLVGD
jgi:tetratricopeptide (TPR) repeat protein